ncbi:MAG: hypothetical protein KKD11_07435 [Candidatus Omnitrophica bacterium]|nr:hypothetical protein [Candidatus Omnitrophota bacterium]
MNQELLKIIDANLNRTREGLRVCEDIARFAVIDKKISRSLKAMRHSVTKALLSSKRLALRQLVKARDTKNDPMKFVDFEKQKGTNIQDIFMANIQRVKESLRVMEECCKILDQDVSRKYRKLRFDAYNIEKRAVKK